ncbi:hypothetical protein F5146DRAFT_1130537 [Armillaria mellea]|nr:hypothetical protein F5146DRAFT_1130537 [Armillaria mellea]
MKAVSIVEGPSIDFLVTEDLSEDICLGSDWYTFLHELLPSGLHDSYTHVCDSVLRGDVFADGVNALAVSGLVSPHSPASCPIPGIEAASLPTRSVDNALPEEATTLFIDDADVECYATVFASGLRIAYAERPHLGYLRDLFFGLSDDAPHLHVNSCSLLHEALMHHGIEFDGLSGEECRMVYASHLSTSACMLGENSKPFPACATLAQHYSTPQTFVTDVVDIVTSYLSEDSAESLRTRDLLSKVFVAGTPNSEQSTELIIRRISR